MEQLPPFRLVPRLESRVWGGQTLGPWLGLPDPPQQLAEVWLVYDQNPIAGGPFAGRTLGDMTREHGAALVGATSFARSGARFPLLAKFLDAADHLSVQVHPGDAYAHSREAASGFDGKTEAWHILHAAPGAELIHGFARATSRAAVAAAIADDSIMGLLRRIPAQAGATVFVPAGTVHAINAGVMLFEIQQTSDLTYRVYDYGRPRELHLERALDVLDYAAGAGAVTTPQAISADRAELVRCEYFAMERWALAAPIETATNPATCEIVTVIDGELAIRSHAEPTIIRRGEAAVLPASLGAYRLEPAPAATLLRCYVP